MGKNKRRSSSNKSMSRSNSKSNMITNDITGSITGSTSNNSIIGIKKVSSMKKITSNSNIETQENTNIITDIDAIPFARGLDIVVEYRDGSHRLAKVIERNNKDENIWSYYVHYYDFNRRMDEWIDISRIIAFPSKAKLIAQQQKIPHGINIHDDKSSSTNSEDEDDNSVDNDDKSFGNASSSSTDNTVEITVPNYSIANTIDFISPLEETNFRSEVTTIAELEYDEHAGLDEASLREHEEVTKVKNFRYVQLGKHIMECWYFSPFPYEYYYGSTVDCIYFCEFSMRFFKSKNELIRFQSNAKLPRHPPGNEIYRDETLSMFEVDGAVEKIYCQNLCYFAKLFLDHKTLYWDVDPFLFYVLCTFDNRGYHPVGYFSKEKYSDMGYNLACILTFPSAQRKGFGKFLISFSYELSKKEGKVGSPEKPLSDLGAVSYRSYWASVLLPLLKQYYDQSITLLDLSRMTSILSDDIASVLLSLNLLQYIENKGYILYAPYDIIDKLIEKYPRNGHLVDPTRLHWAPLYITDPRKDKWSLKYYE